MNGFALVRSTTDLVRAREGLGDFFAFRRWQEGQAQIPDALLGIWIAPGIAVEALCIPTSRGHSAAGRPVQIRETAGLSGIWTICWLEIPSCDDRDEVSRLDLLSALIEPTDYVQERISPRRFIPVFPSDAALCEVQMQIRSLRQLYPHHLMAPLYQDRDTGRLSMPDE